MKISKTRVVAYTILGKITSIVGYILGIVSLRFFLQTLFYAIIASQADTNPAGTVYGIIFAFLLLALSIFLIIKGSQIKKIMKRFKQYVSLFSARHMTLLDNIAIRTASSVEFINKDLQMMIRKGFFLNATIDEAANKIVFGKETEHGQTAIDLVTCFGCGVTGVDPDFIHEGVYYCEHCAAVVKAFSSS